MELNLTPVEARVLGSLIEKSLTTPEYYPLTLNSLVAACNQKSNRDPAMQIDDKSVIRALDALRDKKLAWSVALAGSRAPKYRHSAPDVLNLTPIQLAVLCELMLRGPQTLAELRIRAARMAPVTDTTEVESVLQSFADWPTGPLACRLPRQPGQREERYMHRLSGEEPVTAAETEPHPEAARLVVMAENERIAALDARIAVLETELTQLRTRMSDFMRQFQ